jgi:hypothetical protein
MSQERPAAYEARSRPSEIIQYLLRAIRPWRCNRGDSFEAFDEHGGPREKCSIVHGGLCPRVIGVLFISFQKPVKLSAFVTM